MKKIIHTLHFLSKANIPHRIEFVEDDASSPHNYWQLVKEIDRGDAIIDMSISAEDIIQSAAEEQEAITTQTISISGDFIDDRPVDSVFNKIKA